MIEFNKTKKIFHLSNKKISYVMMVDDYGQIINLHYGNKISNTDNLNIYHRYIERGLATCLDQKDTIYSPEYLNLEYPVFGNGDYRSPAIHLQSEDGLRLPRFSYQSYEIYEGKKALAQLPSFSSFAAQSLDITLYDEVLDIKLILTYTIYENNSCLTKSTRLVNTSKQHISIEKIMSSSFALNDSNYQHLSLVGSWANERNVQLKKIDQGITIQSSTRGASGAFSNPFNALLAEDTNEFNGVCYGFNLVYSGNFINEIEVNAINQTRINQGINPFDFNWSLDHNESFQSPEALISYSSNGLNNLSQEMHNLIKSNLVNQSWVNKKRPVLVNNWEATYFDFDETKLLDLASAASDCNIELFVLDDGWFLNRNNDKTSLGDWFVDLDKLPNGLEHLANKVNDKKLKFGLWVEPEMISINSELYQSNPEWCMASFKRTPSHGRNQFVLDLSNPEVIDFLENILTDLLDSANIQYVKWDMNRNMSDVFGSTLTNQKEVYHRYIIGLYDLLNRLTTKYPNILFESCSAGGNRFDLGMLAYMPQVWTSDNTDGYERQKIQYGTSIAYPPSVMGAHVSASPNHQVMRFTSIETRFANACFGILGYEFDLTKLSYEEKEVIAKQVSWYQSKQPLILNGDFYRLISPFKNNDCAWMQVSKDKQEAIVMFAHCLRNVAEPFINLKLHGLDSTKQYQVHEVFRNRNFTLSCDILMNIGLPVDIILGMSDLVGDFTSYLFDIKTI